MGARERAGQPPAPRCSFRIPWGSIISDKNKSGMCTWNIVNVCVRRAGPSQQRKTPLPVSCNFLILFLVWGGPTTSKKARPSSTYLFLSLSPVLGRESSPPRLLVDLYLSISSMTLPLPRIPRRRWRRKTREPQKILFYFTFLKKKKVVCLLLLLLLLSYTDNVPGSLSLSLSSVCGGGHLAWMGKSGGGLPPNNVVFFPFHFKNKKGNQRGEILWLFFLLGKWFTEREDDRECAQCLFSLFFLFPITDKFGVVFLFKKFKFSTFLFYSG